MRVVVTGSTGLVGREVVAAATARGWEVTGLARSEARPCDLTDRAAVDEAVAGARPDLIVHCAALADVDRCEREPEEAHRQNVDATAHVAAAADRAGAHLVHISTDYVFDGTAHTPYDVDDPTGPIQEYGRSKLAAEATVEATAGPAATIVRTSWVSGAHGRSTVRTIIEAADAGRPLRFITDQVGQPTVATDLADRLLALGEARTGGIVHVSAVGPMSWFELARTVLAAAGRDPDVVQPVSLAETVADRPAPRPAYSVLDGRSLVAAGMEPMPTSVECLDALARRIGRR